MATRHSQIHLRYLRARIAEMELAGKQQTIIHVGAEPMTNQEALSYLQGQEDKGHLYFGCPEPNPDGSCPGHRKHRVG